MSALDNQEGGNHYKVMPMQPIEFIVKNNWDFCAGNILKYVCRANRKDGHKDVAKAIHYLDLRKELFPKLDRVPNFDIDIREFTRVNAAYMPEKIRYALFNLDLLVTHGNAYYYALREALHDLLNSIESKNNPPTKP